MTYFVEGKRFGATTNPLAELTDSVQRQAVIRLMACMNENDAQAVAEALPAVRTINECGRPFDSVAVLIARAEKVLQQ
jgi:hypothetical protein